jgi:sugar phosphate isomerase/epimerase
MRLLLSAVLWEKQCKEGLSQTELVGWAEELNLAGVEFRPFWCDQESEIAKAAALIAKTGLAAVYAANDGLLAVDQAQTIQALAALRQSLAIASRLGAKVLRMNLATSVFDASLAKTDWWLAEIREILSEAEKNAILLAVENGPSKDKGDTGLLADLLARVDLPNFKLTFDTANWLYAGVQPEQALEQFLPYIGYVHLKDAVSEQGVLKHSHPGTGLVDVRGLYRQLLASGYDGLAALEFPGGDEPAERARMAADYLCG